MSRGFTIDSSSGSSVMPRRMVLSKADIRESEGSKAGLKHVAANDGRIPNEGEYDLKFQTIERILKTSHSKLQKLIKL